MTPQKMQVCMGASVEGKGLGEGGPVGDALQTDETKRSYYEQVLAHFVDLKPTRTDIIRGIPVYRVLHLIPWLEIRGYSCKSWYVLSQVTELDEFWSHSWQGAAWQKYLNVLILSNGFAAFLVSNLTAILAYILVMLEILPTDEGQHGSKWCSCFGILAYYLILLCYRPWKMIFLDIVCINQEDRALKLEGTVSMGATLRSSKRLLVLWDPTFARRLWCVFELSTFLHTVHGDMTKLTAVPPLWGLVVVLGHAGFSVATLVLLHSTHAGGASGRILILGLAIPCFTVAAHTLRVFCRNIDELEEQLKNFRMSDALSACCQQRFCGRGVSQNHF
ncbi:unnamed protein product [Symbiodinium microadriaticum]|nr:unnamed protein product [Symbiodinium microadriaticum]